MMSFRSSGRGAKPLLFRGLAIAALLPLAACDVDELLDLPDPDVANPSTLNDSTALPAYRAATIGDFSLAYDASAGDNIITYSGMLADEFINSETFPTRIEVDIRKIGETNLDVQAVTRRLYRARTSANEAISAYHRFSPNNIGLAENFSLLAATYILFGENWCSGVPFSDPQPDGTFVYGGQSTTTQIFTRALEAADSAIAAATRAVLPSTTAGNNARNAQLNFARVLRGRILLNLNQPANAAAAVAVVPTNFQYAIFHSENSARENNGVYAFNTLNERVSVANREGTNGLPYRENFTAGDTRTPWSRVGSNLGFDNATPEWENNKYFSRSDTTPLAAGVEARLIEAEAQLRAGNYAGAGGTLAILNALRATPPTTGLSLTVAPLAALPALATATEQENQLFAERASWLWLTAHRNGDLRRLIRQYGRTQAQVYPVGAYHKPVQGGQYGSDVNFPLTVDERNNPEFAEVPTNQSLCLDRNA